MPAGQGDSHLTTLFADVHYYFNDPSSQPRHHRFDRASYLYLFHNAVQQQTKLEIANHAGTPDQDALSGYLNNVRIRYSPKQPTLFTFSVDSPSSSDASQWHLPAYNERNETKYLYKLHTLDVYIWTEKDAAVLLGHLKSLITPSRLDIQHAPKVQSSHPEHRDSMSPVVQQLERTAIGSSFPPRTGSTVSTQSFPGPPSAAIPGASTPAAAPMAYNPAAPAAPEPIAHREKTPPPPDDGTGTGLKAAAKYENVQQPPYASNQNVYLGHGPQQAPYFSGPPQPQPQPQQQQQQQQRQGSVSSIPGQPMGQPQAFQGGFGTPAPRQQPQSTPSFGPFAQSTISVASSPPPQQQFQRQQSFGTHQAQFTTFSGPPNTTSPMPQTPSAPPAYTQTPSQQNPGFAPPPSQFSPDSSQQAPIGGFSSYSYTQPTTGSAEAQDMNTHGAYVGDMHTQLYRPTAEEAAHGHGSHGKQKIPSRKKTATGEEKEKPKLEDSFQRLEGKVGKYLNKLDKLW